MPVKSSGTTKSTSKKPKTASKGTTKTKGVVKKSTPVKKAVSQTKTTSRKSIQIAKPAVQASAVKQEESKPGAQAARPAVSERPAPHVLVKRRAPTSGMRKSKPASRGNQFAFMKAPIFEHAFEVGDNVEVFCDHEKVRERVRGWIKGIVVQVDHKMVAVQFRSNVFLTDGWMVPDRILWYPLASEHIRPFGTKKAASKKDFIPDY